MYADWVRVGSGNFGNDGSLRMVRFWACAYNHDAQNSSDTLCGELDEMRIYDRILSLDEVKLLRAVD